MGVGRITEETRKKLSLVTSGENNGMYGKKHSKETKQKIIEALKGKPLKEETKKLLSKITSNQIWVNNGVVNKRIKENELKYFIENGYQKGRIQFSTDLKQKISKGVSKLIWVNNGSKSYRISAENSNDFLEKGFVKGRGKIKFIKEIVNG